VNEVRRLGEAHPSIKALAVQTRRRVCRTRAWDGTPRSRRQRCSSCAAPRPSIHSHTPSSPSHRNNTVQLRSPSSKHRITLTNPPSSAPGLLRTLSTTAGLFWRTPPAEAPPSAATADPRAQNGEHKDNSRSQKDKGMSRPSTQPRLTPQFCFDQTALRGTLPSETVPTFFRRSELTMHNQTSYVCLALR